ncbi:hypothetical protein EBB07_08015 [Paenibacillaceae bacterium]|nr:hypothetical protein EBB07_08015 [Paenibacillaceae bacterium]
MTVHYRKCKTPEDFAAYSVYFIRNRKAFNPRYGLNDALSHLLGYVDHAQILLVYNADERLVGYGHYDYVDEDLTFDLQGDTVFIHAAILSPDYRRGRFFYEGLIRLFQLIAEEAHNVQHVRFAAEADHRYLNRLYSKFAAVVGQREGLHGMDNIYGVSFKEMLRYLRLEEMTSIEGHANI